MTQLRQVLNCGVALVQPIGVLRMLSDYKEYEVAIEFV